MCNRGIEYVCEVEENINQGKNNNLPSYIPSLSELFLKMLPPNVTARSLSMHYENVILNQRKEAARDDSSISLVKMKIST